MGGIEEYSPVQQENNSENNSKHGRVWILFLDLVGLAISFQITS